MTLFFLAFVGGILTILSPCILPVLPFVFSRADQPFRKSGLPLLLGMAVTFTAFAAVATVGGNWIVQTNQYGRIVAMVVLAGFGLTLLSSSLADLLSRPFVNLGNRLAQPLAGGEGPSTSQSILLGVATGLLWAPCAGPILGLILTGAAVEGASARTAGLLLAYAVGAGLSLAIALLAGGRAFKALKQSLGIEVWVRRALGVAVIAGVAAISLGLDRGVLTQLSLESTSTIEQSLVDRLQPPPKEEGPGMMMMAAGGKSVDGVPETLPDLSGTGEWLNSKRLNRDGLKGQVVLIDFWTYSCINCLRTLPYIRAWADRYRDSGLVVIGVHTPEFPFEKDLGNVQRAVSELNIQYPVALDNDYAVWKAFNNKYWPADYLIDATGKVRHHHFGEGKYEETEKHIQELLKERNGSLSFNSTVEVSGTGREAAPDADVQSFETYIGYERQENFLSPGGIKQDTAQRYTVPAHLELNQWGLSGNWTDGPQVATLNSLPGKIVFRFQSRDLHLVLGPPTGGKPVRFRITIDGKAPGENHGVDTDSQGGGTVTEYRLYQLVRQKGVVEERTFEIEFLDPGVQAFAFTFG